MKEAEIIEGIRKKTGAGVLKTEIQKRRASITVEPAAIRKAVEALLEYRPRFVMIVVIDVGMDIDLLYHFDVSGQLVIIRTTVAKEAGEIGTIVDLVPAADWAEKEAAELFGMNFRAHPQLGHLVLPKDWPSDKPPLRGPFKRALPEQFCPVAESLVSTGMTAPMSPLMQRKRKGVGLPSAPPASFTSEASLSEVQKAMKSVEFDKKAGYDWKKGKLRHT
jgi:NADH:ubiquinone oxidoreductase subunit C